MYAERMLSLTVQACRTLSTRASSSPDLKMIATVNVHNEKR
jgi:hypothetical protein